jgi:hypothetical protein
MMESSTCDYGKLDVWELYPEWESRSIKLNPSDADCFLHLFFSHSSDRVNIEESNSVDNCVEFFLVGPPTSGGRLYVRSFTLSRNALFDCLPEEKDRDAFADRLRELVYFALASDRVSDKALEALSLRTPNHS